MADYPIVHGDTVNFAASFQGITFTGPTTKPMVANGKTTINKKKVAVQTDILGFTLNCGYTTPTHSIPGTGMFQIVALGPDQLTKKDSDGKKKIILKGSQFNALFTMQSPAQKPLEAGGTVPDAPGIYSGKGSFTNDGNTLVKMT